MSSESSDFENIIKEKDETIQFLQSEVSELKQKLQNITEHKMNDIRTIFLDINKIFLEFKSNIDILAQTKDDFFKNKFIEYSVAQSNETNQIFEEKMMKYFGLNQDEKDNDNENKIKEQLRLLELKYQQLKKENEEMKLLIENKEELIQIQNKSLAQSRVEHFEKTYYIQDLEQKFNDCQVNLKMKEDEIECLLLGFQYVSEKKKNDFERTINKLSPNIKDQISNLKLFKKK